MELMLAAIGVLVATGGMALAARRSTTASTQVAVCGVFVAAFLGLVPVAQVLYTGNALVWKPIAWSVPNGSIVIGVDSLSAFFLLAVFLIPPAAALFGSEYLRGFIPRKTLGESWFFFNLVVAAMILVVIARSGLLFLMAWEVMALASYFLIVFDDEREDVRRAGWTYLVASHLGVAFLLPLFIVLGHTAGTLDFEAFAKLPSVSAETLDLLFLLAVVGFGAKAGIMPFHSWIPEAYPAAPGHAPAVLSGVMSKLGVYGLMRIISLMLVNQHGMPAEWWGWLLIVIGALSGILGIASAVAQHNLRRILAYSSIENMGIICIGLGIGLLGLARNSLPMAVLGLAGALLHVLNHAMFKSLLFFGAAIIEQATGTGNINHLGGLLKRLPRVGIPFAIGCVAIAGLPPLNGFASEFLIYLTALRAESTLLGSSGTAALGGIVALTIIGGIAAVCFTMVLGIVFLGEPRTAEAAGARAPGWRMQLPLWIFAAGCVTVGMLAPNLLCFVTPVVCAVTGQEQKLVSSILEPESDPLAAGSLLNSVIIVTGTLLVLSAGLAVLRLWLLQGRTVGASGTWGCGYIQPRSSMQYTGSSFSRSLASMLVSFVPNRTSLNKPDGLFPLGASLSTETPDAGRSWVYEPVFRFIDRSISRLRWLQHGRLHLYVLYVALTIIFLLFWSFGRGA